MNDGKRIEDAGGIVNIGDECFGLFDGTLLCWRGQNYVPQRTTLRAWLHNLWVRFRNRRR